jgi:hypothetical protein
LKKFFAEERLFTRLPCLSAQGSLRKMFYILPGNAY